MPFFFNANGESVISVISLIWRFRWHSGCECSMAGVEASLQVRPNKGILYVTDVHNITWGVLLSQHQRQKLVRESLTSSHVEYFMPMMEEVRVVSGRHIHRLTPLLGRYVLFVVDEFWKSISSLRGVAGLMLTAEYQPAKVDHGQLMALRSLCVNGVYNKQVVETGRGFVYGQRVTPSSGPLACHVGRYDGLASKHREAAVFTLFGRDQRLMFKAGDLLAA